VFYFDYVVTLELLKNKGEVYNSFKKSLMIYFNFVIMNGPFKHQSKVFSTLVILGLFYYKCQFEKPQILVVEGL
jgi:hypothetical protein